VGDLQNRCDIEDAMEKARPDAVMHFAANALVGESMTNPSKYFRNNVRRRQPARRHGRGRLQEIRLQLHLRDLRRPRSVPIDETLPQKPINPYGESKLMFEQVLRWYDEIHGVKHVALRYFNAAGASGRYGEDHRIETHLIPNILKVALGQKEHVEIYGTDYPTPDGTCIRDYIHIIDLAQAHMLALAHSKKARVRSSIWAPGRHERARSHRRVRSGERQEDRRCRKAAPPRRSAAPHRGQRPHQERAGLDASSSRTSGHRRERVGVARRPSARLRGLIRGIQRCGHTRC
jgi:UDP-glucose 4-epimerase